MVSIYFFGLISTPLGMGSKLIVDYLTDFTKTDLKTEFFIGNRLKVTAIKLTVKKIIIFLINSIRAFDLCMNCHIGLKKNFDYLA